MEDIYESLKQDLMDNCEVDYDQADIIVDWMQNNDLLDYDLLKEFYIYPEEDADDD